MTFRAKIWNVERGKLGREKGGDKNLFGVELRKLGIEKRVLGSGSLARLSRHSFPSLHPHGGEATWSSRGLHLHSALLCGCAFAPASPSWTPGHLPASLFTHLGQGCCRRHVASGGAGLVLVTLLREHPARARLPQVPSRYFWMESSLCLCCGRGQLVLTDWPLSHHNSAGESRHPWLCSRPDDCPIARMRKLRSQMSCSSPWLPRSWM